MSFESLKPPAEDLPQDLEEYLDNFDLEEHESLELGLKELRRKYDNQEKRRQSIETKIVGIIGISGILFGLIQAILDKSGSSSLMVLASIFVSASLLVSIWNLYPKNYQLSMASKEIPTYTYDEPQYMRVLMYKYYFSAEYFNSELNDVRYRWFLISLAALLVGIIFLGTSVFVQYT